MSNNRDYNSIFNAIYNVPNPNQSEAGRTQTMTDALHNSAASERFMSLAGWRLRTQAARQAVLKYCSEQDAKLNDLKRVYSAEYIKTMEGNIDAEKLNVVSRARELVRNDYETVKQAKEAAWSKAHSAPSDDQLRLLQALSMRSKLTPAEVAAVLPQMTDNIQALRVLQDVAERSGVNVPLPTDLEDQYERDIEMADEWCKIAVEDINKSDDDAGYLGLLFWNTNNSGQMQSAYDRLDSFSFLDPGQIASIADTESAEA